MPLIETRGSGSALSYGLNSSSYIIGSYTYSLQDPTYPHSTNMINSGATKTTWPNGFSEESNQLFGLHDSNGTTNYGPGGSKMPLYVAIYFGDNHPNGVKIQDFTFSAHGNHFKTFEFQGSNNSGKAEGFHNAGSWTTLYSGTAESLGAEYELLNFSISAGNQDFYKAYRIRILSSDTSGGLASYWWRLNGIPTWTGAPGTLGLSPYSPATGGKALVAAGYTYSGRYWIKPEGFTGDPKHVYVDMKTDGGGWVLSGVYSSRAGYTMDAYQSGLFENEVGNHFSHLRPTWNGTSGGPANLSKDFIDKLFNQTNSDKSYMGTVATDTNNRYSHWKLTQKSANYNSSFNAFGAIYATGLCNNTFNHTYTDYTNTGNNAVHYVGKSLSTATTNYTNGRSGYLTPYQDNIYHYLPDDLGGSYRWIFRENVDDASHNALSQSVNDMVFIR